MSGFFRQTKQGASTGSTLTPNVSQYGWTLYESQSVSQIIGFVNEAKGYAVEAATSAINSRESAELSKSYSDLAKDWAGKSELSYTNSKVEADRSEQYANQTKDIYNAFLNVAANQRVIETFDLEIDQTVVNFAKVIADASFVSINGQRVDSSYLVKDVDYTITGISQITLKRRYPLGTKLSAVQDIKKDESIPGVSESAAVWNRRFVSALIGASYSNYVEMGITVTPRLVFEGVQYLPLFDSNESVDFTGAPSKQNNGNLIIETNKGSREFSRLEAEAVPSQDLSMDNVKKYGATGGLGGIDDGSALSAVYQASKNGRAMFMPKGIYKVGTNSYPVGSDSIWLNRGFTGGVSFAATAAKSPLLITVENPDEPVMNGAHTRVGINITAKGVGAQHIDCIRASLINHSTDGQGNTAIYASASSVPGALWSAALHGETKHQGGTSMAISSENASYTTTGTFYGCVINNTTGSAAETHPTTGASVVTHPEATALYITGGDTRGDKGQWVRGIRYSPKSMRPNGTLIRDESKCAQGYWSRPESTKTLADIYLQGSAQYGILLDGKYSSGKAIRLSTGVGIAYEGTGAIHTKYQDIKWGIYNGDVPKAEFSTSTPGMLLGGRKVVGEQVRGIKAMTGTASGGVIDTETATIQQLAQYVKKLSDALAAHGLIGV